MLHNLASLTLSLALASTLTAAAPQTAATGKAAAPQPLGPVAASAAKLDAPSTDTAKAKPATTASSPLDAAEESESDPFSDTLMVSTISFLNQSYVSIGVLADAAGKEAYEDEELADLIDLHHALAEQVEEQLRTLAKSRDLDAEDVAAINELAKLAQLNKWQCEALAGVYSGDATKEKVWEQLREAAYKELAKYSDEEESETPASAETGSTPQPTAAAPAKSTPK